jgi:aspartyl-tRNA synthetase
VITTLPKLTIFASAAIANTAILREVLPIPKMAKAIDLVRNAPTPVSDRQLKQLGIAAVPKRDL